ncbi:MAG TPA: alpha/beta hydrolase [Gemmatimonadaceae bacterium]|nr:alpha/beta hydrolase [Gemmatimonadaceae bacterium]
MTARGRTFAVFTSPPVTDATPLVCVNGGLLYSHELLWPALAPLARRRQLVLYDQRGRGESEAPPHPSAARIEDDAADLGAIRQALGVARWDVLGHSWGGGIAMLGTERDRAGTRRVVLVDSVGPTSEWMDGLIEGAARRLTPAGRARLRRFDRAAMASPNPLVQSAASHAILPAWLAEPDFSGFVPLPRSTSLTGSAIAARLWREGYDWSPVFRAVQTPTIVIHGERDLLPQTVADAITRLVPRATPVAIPDSGHFPFLESPQRFFELVEGFLSP